MHKPTLLHVFSSLTLLAACSAPSTSAPEPSSEHTEATAKGADVTLELHAAPDGAIGEVAAASAGDRGAIVYSESEGWTGSSYAQTRVKLQRLDAKGAALGSPTELAVLSSSISIEPISRLTLASDGMKYIACWGGSNIKISCASAPLDQGDALPALTIDGRWPSLAYGPGGWTLGYGTGEQMGVLRLDANGMGVGEPVLVPGSADPDTQVFLTATPVGVALMGESEGSMRLHFFHEALSEVADPIDLGQMYWFHGALAASGTKVAVSLGYPYEGRLTLLDNGTITETRTYVAEAGKTGLEAALGMEGSSFGMLSADTELGLQYGSINEEGDLPPSAAALNEQAAGYVNGALALARIEDETFLIATQGQWKRGGKLLVARVRRS